MLHLIEGQDSMLCIPADNNKLEVNINTRARCELCSKLTIKRPERRQWRRSGFWIVNFEHILRLALVFLLLTLSGWILAKTFRTKISRSNFESCILFKWSRYLHPLSVKPTKSSNTLKLCGALRVNGTLSLKLCLQWSFSYSITLVCVVFSSFFFNTVLGIVFCCESFVCTPTELLRYIQIKS